MNDLPKLDHAARRRLLRHLREPNWPLRIACGVLALMVLYLLLMMYVAHGINRIDD